MGPRRLGRRLWRPSLGLQVIGLAVLVALLGGGVVGFVVSRTARTTLRDYVRNEVLGSSDRAALLTARYLEKAEGASRELATSSDLVLAAAAGQLHWATADIERWQVDHPHIDVDLVDIDGTLRATSLPDKSLVGQKLASEADWLPNALATVAPYLGRPGPEDGTQQPRVPYAVRLLDARGNVRGVLLASISLQALADRLNALPPGPNAHTAVLDLQDRLILAHPDPRRILQPAAGHTEMFRNLRPGDRTVDDNVVYSSGKHVLAATSAVPGVPWAIIVSQPIEDAFAPVDAMTQVALFIIGTTLIVALLVGTLLALRIVRPLRHLQATAEAMAGGDFSQRANLDREDEAGQLGTAFDHMADQLQATIMRANESEGRIRAVMNSVADAIITFDQAGRIGECNPAAEKLFGCPSNELLDRPIDSLLASRVAREQIVTRPDGSRVPLEVSVSETMLDSQRRFIVVARDISVRKEAERERETHAQSERFRALLTTATHAATAGGETVERLLQITFAPLSKGDRQPVDLAGAVRDAVQLTSPKWRDAAQAEGRPIRMSVQVEAQPVIEASPSHIRDAIVSLLGNAVDAMPAGGTIRVRVALEDRTAVLEVSDSGIGMSPELQERVFEPFFTTKGAAGTGLGLAMVFGIVEQHRGHIEVQSALGQGATFRITLPRVSESNDRPQAA